MLQAFIPITLYNYSKEESVKDIQVLFPHTIKPFIKAYSNELPKFTKILIELFTFNGSLQILKMGNFGDDLEKSKKFIDTNSQLEELFIKIVNDDKGHESDWCNVFTEFYGGELFTDGVDKANLVNMMTLNAQEKNSLSEEEKEYYGSLVRSPGSFHNNLVISRTFDFIKNGVDHESEMPIRWQYEIYKS